MVRIPSRHRPEPAAPNASAAIASASASGQPSPAAEIQNIYPISFGHNGLRCLPVLNGATCALGNFPECLTAHSALTARRTLLPTTTHAFILLCGPPPPAMAAFAKNWRRVREDH